MLLGVSEMLTHKVVAFNALQIECSLMLADYFSQRLHALDNMDLKY